MSADRFERQALRDSGDPPVPGEREAAEECCRQVVRVRLQGEARGQKLFGAGVGGGRHEAECDSRSRRAEPALERDPVR